MEGKQSYSINLIISSTFL